MIAVVVAVLLAWRIGLAVGLGVGVGLIMIGYFLDRYERRTDPSLQKPEEAPTRELALGVYEVSTKRAKVTIPANQIGNGASVWAQRWWSKRPEVFRWDTPEGDS